MSPDELIRRLHEVIDTALSDSLTVENDRAVGRAEIEACEAERREAEAVRDEVTAALRRLADVIEYAESVMRERSDTIARGMRVGTAETFLDIARGETNERESNA